MVQYAKVPNLFVLMEVVEKILKNAPCIRDVYHLKHLLNVSMEVALQRKKLVKIKIMSLFLIVQKIPNYVKMVFVEMIVLLWNIMAVLMTIL